MNQLQEQLRLTFERADQTGRGNQRMIGQYPVSTHREAERWPFWRLNFID
jgi:hypothetical protein